MKISIVVPAYNEEKRIGQMLEAYINYFENFKKESSINYEILVVINNTTDRTEEIVKKFRDKYGVRYLNLKPGGKGFAIKAGFKDALKRDNDLIGFVDADMATPPEEFAKLITNIGLYNGSIANRYMEGSKIIPAFTFRRIIVSRIFNFLVRILFLMNHRDTQCGAKLFRRKTIEVIINQLSITQFAIDVDILYLAKKAGFKIKEVPTHWTDVEHSTINLKKDSIRMFFAILQLRIINSPLKRLLEFGKPIINMVYRIVK